MKKRTGLYSRRCFINGRLQEAIIFIEQGKITEIRTARKILRNEAVQDYGEAVLMPGVIDAHVHLNEPGRTEWEGFETGTLAAAYGGTTSLVDMPLNASPVTTNSKALNTKLQSASGKTNVHCGFYGGLIPGNINQLPDLIAAGVLGIKAFLVHSGINEFPNTTLEDLDTAMPLLAKADIPLLVHCEIPDGTGGFSDYSEPLRYQHYLNSRPPAWEVSAIEAVIDLCKKHRCKTHIVHVSSAQALDLIEQARENNL
ncbi:MAG TPA: amidohydrolase family protein, partial [Rhodothermales bacterium]|nr:amidohydrolase family protein [Rhodothermales bacterium]